METLTPTVAAHSVLTRAPAWGSRLFRAGVCATGLLLSGAPALAASPALAANPASVSSGQVQRAPGDLPGSRAVARTSDPTLPREPSPTGTQLPDPASDSELNKGEYGVGLGLLILAGVIVTAAVVGLFMLLMRRTWGDHHEAGAPSRH